MIISTAYKNKKVGVLGLGKAGIFAAYSMILGGSKVFAWDDSIKMSNSIESHLKKDFLSDEQQTALLKAIDDGLLIIQDLLPIITDLSALFVTPGIGITPPKQHTICAEAIKNNTPIISDFDLLWKKCNKSHYIGITGTNGKSTTTALLGHIFKEIGKDTEVGGNIGTSVLDLKELNSDGFYILEASSFQIERLNDTIFNTAILLNITPDHLDRYNSFEDYMNAKASLFKNQTTSDYAIISIDCPNAAHVYNKLKGSSKSNIIPISCRSIIDQGISLIDGYIHINFNEKNEKIHFGHSSWIPGAHNEQNILAAFAAAFLNGLPPKEVVKAIHSFKGLEHRMKLAHQYKGLKFVNDSKATNVDACEKALQTYENIYWIAGGISKDSGIESLSGLFYKIKHAFLIGAAAVEFSYVLQKHNIPYTISHTLENAMRDIKLLAPKEGVVLLSPACASLDQWKNFEERGNAFSNISQNWETLI